MADSGISISFGSGRGGSGKSTVCANLGVALAQMGIKTVVVDADVEGASLNLIFGVDFDVSTIHDYLSGRASVSDIVFKHEKTGVDLIVGSVKVESLKDVEFDTFRELIKGLKEKYDIVLIDIPAGLSVDTMTSLSASDVVVFVVTPDILSVSSALKTKVITKGMDLKVLGAIVNRAGGEYDIPADYIEDMLGVMVLSTIAEDDEVRRSLSAGQILMQSSPTSQVAQAIKHIASKLVG